MFQILLIKTEIKTEKSVKGREGGASYKSMRCHCDLKLIFIVEKEKEEGNEKSIVATSSSRVWGPWAIQILHWTSRYERIQQIKEDKIIVHND